MTSACDVILIGGGIMSATLGVLLKRLWPEATIDVFERLDRVAAESSDAWNNAGTGHSAFCELNYTPAAADGSVDVGKAVAIAGQFGESLAFWRALVADGVLPQTPSFIRRVPHLSFVTGSATSRTCGLGSPGCGRRRASPTSNTAKTQRPWRRGCRW
jgi:malate dehydrogenase (quinone)